MSRKDRTKCHECKAPPAPGRICCQECAVKIQKRRKARSLARRANGECVLCKAPANDGKRHCEPCRIQYNIKARERRKRQAQRVRNATNAEV